MSEIKSIYPDLKKHVTKTSSGSNVVSYTSDLGDNTPILTLIHGYPQSAFIFRYLVPILKDKISLFVPELPGYGISSPAKDNSKRGVGGALLEALQSTFNISESSPRKVVLGGHDRGARIVHRLAVDKDKYPALNVLGAIMMDIVPTKAQWDAFSDPLICSGYFHWPLLANVEISVAMIKAYGGARWTTEAHHRIKGPSEIGAKRLADNNAIELHAQLFDKEETLIYSAEDYSTGARIDVEQQIEDQKAGRKIEVPTLVMFSSAKLGARIDVEKVWRDWIGADVPYKGVGIGDGYGHYLPEEAYDVVSEHIIEFLKSYA